ncbi:SAYSvFN domain-containing protein 1-like [Trichomycterus rosablanca]|uniref:SAYSvFN domain-containing protein 1-like n=1 Tax=Trichomycterus rosablanca TaxID=2290929 RepID=UPI002F35096B
MWSESNHCDSTHQDSSDWLLDSAVGRWLGVDRLAVTNLTLLKVLLWLVLLGLFCELDFGLPFFLISLFYWLYEGLRSPTLRRPGEMSAYSVFNPDCQPILGTLTAEQLEGEMGYRLLNTGART